MTERELFKHNIPRIAEIIVEAKELNEREYSEWKEEVMRKTEASSFREKLFHAIERVLHEI